MSEDATAMLKQLERGRRELEVRRDQMASGTKDNTMSSKARKEALPRLDADIADMTAQIDELKRRLGIH